MIQLNCQTSGENRASFLAQFNAFEIAPVDSNTADDGSTYCQVCEIGSEEFFTIYGRCEDGTALAIHDAYDAAEIATTAKQIATETGLGFYWFDTRNGMIPRPANGPVDLIALTDALTSEIHDQIPGYDKPEDFREDDFDSHPLAAIREALADASGYHGEPDQ